MKYHTHYSKTAAIEDATKNAHMPVFADPVYKVSQKKPVQGSIAPSDAQIAAVIGYMHGHKNTQLSALSTSDAGIRIMKYMKEKLDLAGNELLRMEYESGNALTLGQTAKVEMYSRESRCIEKALHTAENKPQDKIQSSTRNDNKHCMT